MKPSAPTAQTPETTLVETKSIFKSKTFWLNVIGAASIYSGMLPEKYAAPILMGGNIAVRFLTNQPVTFSGNK